MDVRGGLMEPNRSKQSTRKRKRHNALILSAVIVGSTLAGTGVATVLIDHPAMAAPISTVATLYAATLATHRQVTERTKGRRREQADPSPHAEAASGPEE